ncbi:MAG: cytochrome c peroxidase [Pyrinomonadaceae bacterium]
MKRLKIFVCVAFVAVAGAFVLVNSEAVTGQDGSSALSAPTGVNASDSKYNSKVTIWWDTIRGATSYRLFRNVTNNPATATDIGTTVSNFFQDGSIPAGQTAFYWVRAENSSTVSDMSVSDQGTRTNTPSGPAPQLNPPPPAPVGNETTATKIYLGKALFWDEQMSSTRTVSCGTCHHSNNGGTDPRSVASTTINPGADAILGTPDDVRGSAGVPFTNPDGSYTSVPNYGLNAQVTGRKSVSHINSAYPPILFWDGRATGQFIDPLTNNVLLPNGAALESQAAGPPVSSSEMAHTGRDWSDVAARMAVSKPLALSPSIPTALNTWINGRTYSDLFLEAFGTAEVTPARISMAIAAYERALYTDQAPIDLDGAGIANISAAAARGRGIFNGPAGCNVCHAGPLFSDNSFRNIGVRPANEDTGRFQATGNNQNIGEFRVPDLRNVSLRGSFFHNGQFTTLAQVVAFYNRGGDFRNAPNFQQALIRPLGLNGGQQNDLVAFLQSLTDPRLVTESAPFDRPMLFTESAFVPTLTGSGIAGSGGFVPEMKIFSPPIVGNTNFTVSMSNALGNAQATLVIAGVQPGNTPGPVRNELKRLTVNTANTGAGNGWSSVSFTFSLPRKLRGMTFYARWYVQDPSAPGGYAVSQVAVINAFNTSASGSLTSKGDELQEAVIEVIDTDRKIKNLR